MERQGRLRVHRSQRARRNCLCYFTPPSVRRDLYSATTMVSPTPALQLYTDGENLTIASGDCVRTMATSSDELQRLKAIRFDFRPVRGQSRRLRGATYGRNNLYENLNLRCQTSTRVEGNCFLRPCSTRHLASEPECRRKMKCPWRRSLDALQSSIKKWDAERTLYTLASAARLSLLSALTTSFG